MGTFLKKPIIFGRSCGFSLEWRLSTYKSINLINTKYWGDGIWGTGDASAPPDFGRDRNKAFSFETPSMYTQYPIIRNGDQR